MPISQTNMDATPNAKPSTILIIDDDKTVIEQLVTHFRRRNFEPVATANSTQVDQILDAFQVHLILLDLRMERLSGYDVLRKLKDRNISVPVLIITAYYNDEKERLAAAGITQADIIEKPFRDFAKIEAKINQKLSHLLIPEEVGSDYEDEIYYDNRTQVVVVDDEQEILDLLAEFLRERQYEVVTFKNGKDCIAYMEAHPKDFQLGIIDMAIPGLSGDKVIQAALKLNPKLKFIPISARYIEEMRSRLRAIGFDPARLVTKPFDIPTLIEQVKVLAIEAGTLGKK